MARLLAAGPTNDAPTGYSGFGRMSRRVAARLTRHQTLHQRAIDEALRQGLLEVGADVARAGNRLDRTEERLVRLELQAARLLDELRRQASPSLSLPADAAFWQRRLRDAWGDRDAGLFPPAVRLDTSVGTLLVAAHDRVMLPLLRDEGWWEDDECDQLRALLKPGMTFVDIGAHVGFMTLLGARAVGATGRVLSVEAAPSNFALLRANVANNGLNNVEAIPAAALDRTGTVTLSLSPFNTGDHRAYAVPATDTLVVPAVALDDLIPDIVTVDVVKVDAQGTDHLAILGMRRTLARSHSVLLVEYWPPGIAEAGEDPLAVLAVYQSLGYETRVLGEAGDGPPPTSQHVVDAALATAGGFCSLVLRPSV